MFDTFSKSINPFITKVLNLDSLSGQIFIQDSSSFDYELVKEKLDSSVMEFDIIVNDQNNFTDTAKVRIAIKNLNEIPKILNARVLTFVEKDSIIKPVVKIESLPDFQDITKFEIQRELDSADFLINRSNGVINFKSIPVYKEKNKYQFIVKALDINGNIDTALFTVIIIPLPPMPVSADTAIYKLGSSNAPSTFTKLVSQPTDDAKIRWRFAESPINNWIDTIPRMPDSVGRYNYIIKTFDTITGLYSKDSSVVNIVIRPYDPIVKDSTYIVGSKYNPNNIGVQVKGMPRNKFNFFTIDSVLRKSSGTNGGSSYQYKINSSLAVMPSLPAVAGKFKFAVNQLVNTVDSDTIPFTVNMIELKDVLKVSYLMDNPILQSNSTFNIPMKVVVSNLLTKPFDSVQIQTNLKDMMPIGVEYKVIELSGSYNIKVDPQFDGNANINLVAPNISIPEKSVDTVKMIVNLIPNGFNGTLKNNVEVKVKTQFGPVSLKSSKSLDDAKEELTSVLIPDVLLKIPEIFTPNMDQINDKFVIVRPYGMRIELEVYNRWGTIVYTNRDYQNEWDGRGTGRFFGQDLVNGGYYYKIKTTNAMNETQFFNGYVVIQR